MMIHLEVLNLGHNRLRGPLPAELQLIEKLKELTLNDNLLTGPVPEFLANMPRSRLCSRNKRPFYGP